MSEAVSKLGQGFHRVSVDRVGREGRWVRKCGGAVRIQMSYIEKM